MATAKPEPAALLVMEHFKLAPYFDVIAGASMDYSRVEKSDVIRYALDRAGTVSYTHLDVYKRQKYT